MSRSPTASGGRKPAAAQCRLLWSFATMQLACVERCSQPVRGLGRAHATSQLAGCRFNPYDGLPSPSGPVNVDFSPGLEARRTISAPEFAIKSTSCSRVVTMPHRNSVLVMNMAQPRQARSWPKVDGIGREPSPPSSGVRDPIEITTSMVRRKHLNEPSLWRQINRELTHVPLLSWPNSHGSPTASGCATQEHVGLTRRLASRNSATRRDETKTRGDRQALLHKHRSTRRHWPCREFFPIADCGVHR